MKKAILFLFSLPLFLIAQETITISGYMEEEETGEKLIGGTVYDLNSKNGTITNDYGFYSLTIPKDSVNIKISFIGFEPQFYTGFPEKDIILNFKMISIMLNEVVVLADKEEQVHLRTGHHTFKGPHTFKGSRFERFPI